MGLIDQISESGHSGELPQAPDYLANAPHPPRERRQLHPGRLAKAKTLNDVLGIVEKGASYSELISPEFRSPFFFGSVRLLLKRAARAAGNLACVSQGCNAHGPSSHPSCCLSQTGGGEDEDDFHKAMRAKRAQKLMAADSHRRTAASATASGFAAGSVPHAGVSPTREHPQEGASDRSEAAAKPASASSEDNAAAMAA